MKSVKSCALLALLSLSASLPAFSQVLVLGKQTALQQKTIGTEKQKQLSPANRTATREQHAAIDESQLKGIKTVYINAQQARNSTSNDMDYVHAAVQKHIPVVIENADKETMLAVAGISIDAKVAIVEGLVNERGVRLTIIEDGENAVPPGVTLAPNPVNVSAIDSFKVQFKPTEENLKRMKVEKESLRNKPFPLGKQTAKPTGRNSQKNLDELSKETIKALKVHETKRFKSKEATDGGRGQLYTQEGDAIVSSDPDFGLGNKNLRGQFAGISMPTYAEHHIDMNWVDILKEWVPYGSQKAVVNVNYDIWLYASTSPEKKWMKISTKGSGINPGTLVLNEKSARGFFTEGAYLFFGPYFQGGKLEKSAPQNANDQTGVAITTGFSIGASAGVDKSGPSVGVNATYSSEETRSTTISDFEVLNDCSAQWAKFNYKMSSAKDGTSYNSWTDLFKKCAFCYPELRDLPTWATNNFLPETEALWAFPADHNKSELLYFYQHHFMRATWLYSYSLAGEGWYNTATRNERFDKFPYADFSLVQLPHLGIDASVKQSSIASNGHPSRAVDGLVDGVFSKSSVSSTKNEASPYWEVDLGEPRTNKVIKNLVIWNRTDCCGAEIRDAQVFISDVPFTSTNYDATVAQANSSGGTITMKNIKDFALTDNRRQTIPVGRTGRYIRVQKRTGVIAIAEIQIVPQGY